MAVSSLRGIVLDTRVMRASRLKGLSSSGPNMPAPAPKEAMSTVPPVPSMAACSAANSISTSSGVGPVLLGGSMMMRGDALVRGCASRAWAMTLWEGQCAAALLLSLDLWTRYACRISLVRCSMMPRCASTFPSLTWPSSPSSSRTACVLQPILLNSSQMLLFNIATVSEAASNLFSYRSAWLSAAANRSSTSRIADPLERSSSCPLSLYRSISTLMTCVWSSSFSISLFTSFT
mmetsp:Transcript_22865/g.63197  ORF Transcript_22865/g.63197 Transcript_22865/m.63197 type:complete len:234 (+) Transcript_22865:361-1062(+)